MSTSEGNERVHLPLSPVHSPELDSPKSPKNPQEAIETALQSPENPPKSPDNESPKAHENVEPEEPKTPTGFLSAPAVLKVTPAILKVKKAMSTFHVNSPSDAIMSPCTAQLNNRAGAKPKRLFRPEKHQIAPKKLNFDDEAE